MANPFADKSEPKIGVKPFPQNNQTITLEFPSTIKRTYEIPTDGTKTLREIKYTILGNVPSKSNCYRIVTFKSKDPEKTGFSTLAKTKELRQYEKDFAKQWVNRGMISVDFKFEMDIYYPSKRSDLDGCLKVILDCLQPKTEKRPFGVGAIENDNLCQDIHIRRNIDKSNPRIEFVITPINQ